MPSMTAWLSPPTVNDVRGARASVSNTSEVPERGGATMMTGRSKVARGAGRARGWRAAGRTSGLTPARSSS